MAQIKNMRGWKVSIPVKGGVIDLGPYEVQKVRRQIIEELNKDTYQSPGLLKFIELVPDPPKKNSVSNGPSTKTSYVIDLDKKKDKVKKKVVDSGKQGTKEEKT